MPPKSEIEEKNFEVISPETMSEMVEYIAKALSDKPEDVKVSTKQEDRQIIITLELHEDDKGKVIGKGGRVAQSIRSLLRVAAVKTNTRAILEIK